MKISKSTASVVTENLFFTTRLPPPFYYKFYNFHFTNYKIRYVFIYVNFCTVKFWMKMRIEGIRVGKKLIFREFYENSDCKAYRNFNHFWLLDS